MNPGIQDEIRLDQFPEIDPFLHKPLLVDPPMCTLKELEDGTYSLYDILVMHEIIDFKTYLSKGVS